MSEAWSTLVTKHSDFDDYARSSIYALMAWDAKRCSVCGNYDCLVPLKSDLRLVTWTNHNGEQFEVHQYRCLACGARDIVQRDFNEIHKDDKPTPGTFAAGDGRQFVARPAEEV